MLTRSIAASLVFVCFLAALVNGYEYVRTESSTSLVLAAVMVVCMFVNLDTYHRTANQRRER